MTDFFMIVNENDNGLFWSNTYGWIDNDDNTTELAIFSKEEKEIFNLPIEGKWFKL